MINIVIFLCLLFIKLKHLLSAMKQITKQYHLHVLTSEIKAFCASKGNGYCLDIWGNSHFSLLGDNSVHLHECSPFYVGIIITKTTILTVWYRHAHVWQSTAAVLYVIRKSNIMLGNTISNFLLYTHFRNTHQQERKLDLKILRTGNY